MRAAVLGLALLAAGCSGGEKAAEAPLAGNEVAAPVPTTPPPSGNKLVGAVSALNADQSALNVRITDTSRIIDLPTDTLFAFDSDKLSPGSEGNLLKAADLIRQSPAGDLRVVGHTDSKGSDDYNLDLSRRRAEAVATWLRGQVGVRQRTIATEGKGESDPIAPNTNPNGTDDPAGRTKNRRVEIVIPR